MLSSGIKHRWLAVFVMIMLDIMSMSQTLTIKKGVYSSVYDLELQSPKQVWWTLRSSDLGDVSREPSWKFMPDILDERATARHEDYLRSGYHRGHLCPAADRSNSIDAMRQTFTTSNICPQTPRLNMGAWKRTEEWCRKAALSHDSVCVLVVPIWLDRDTTFIGRHRLAVPHAFFKACWLSRNDSVINAWFIFNK